MASNNNPVAAINNNSKPRHSGCPVITTGNSEEYNKKAYHILAHAMLPNPTWKAMFSEDKDVSNEELVSMYESAIRSFHDTRAEKGAFVAEAGAFAACALWWPPGSQDPPPALTASSDGESEIDKIEREMIWSRYGNDFWQLGLIARDPRKPALPGAVRALLQPFVDRASAEGKPIWLRTTSEHAKDIYLHFGWRVVGEEMDRGHKSSAMILLPPT